MKHLQERGYRRLHAGASRAFLKDGVLCYKKKWGMRLTSARSPGFWIRPIGSNVGVAAFLKNNPFIYHKEGRFQGVVFLDTEKAATEEVIGSLYQRYGMPGMSGIDMYLPGSNSVCMEVSSIEAQT